MKIDAAVISEKGGTFDLQQLDADGPRDGELLVEIKGVGLCHTDLLVRDQFISMKLPAVLGHEGAGIVKAVGAGVADIGVGDHVVLSFSSCGHCRRCDQDLPSYCQSFAALNYVGRRPDGTTPLSKDGKDVSSYFFGQSSFATHAVVPRSSAIKVTPSVPIELMGPLGCGVQTGVGGILRSLGCAGGSSIAIFGGGTVGLSAVMGAKIAGCRTIIMVEPVAERRQLAMEFGATHVIDPNAGLDVVADIRALQKGGVDYAFDTSGLPAVISSALKCLGSYGALGLVGMPPTQKDVLSINLATAVAKGIQVKGIIEGDSDPQTFIPELIGYFERGDLPIDRMIRTYALDQINEAVADHSSGSVVKAVLLPTSVT